MKYVVLTLDDARQIADALPDGPGLPEPVQHFRARMAAETGADMQEAVDALQKLDLCAACSIEAQESDCRVLAARRLGRRLRRLLERARGERAPGEEDDSQ